jgi:hypothetical protein
MWHSRPRLWDAQRERGWVEERPFRAVKRFANYANFLAPQARAQRSGALKV